MLSSIALLALFAAAQAAVSGDYCYSDSQICTAFADSGFVNQVDNKTIMDRDPVKIPKVFKAYVAIVTKLCTSTSNPTECGNCFKCEGGKDFTAMHECGKENKNTQFTRTNAYLEQGYSSDTVTLTFDASRIGCYMNQKAQLLFGQFNGTRTYVRPQNMPQVRFRTWMLRAMIVTDYVDLSVTKDDAKACKVAGDSQILEMAGNLEFFGLTAQELKEEVVCRCLANQQQ